MKKITSLFVLIFTLCIVVFGQAVKGGIAGQMTRGGEDENNSLYWIIGAAVAIFFIFGAAKKKSTQNNDESLEEVQPKKRTSKYNHSTDLVINEERTHGNLIPDSKVTLNTIIASLEDFELYPDTKLKEGYTESYVQKKLLLHFQKKFVHVVREYVLEGKNGITIDFDFGNGKVGVETKLAKSVFKASEQQRMIGQIDLYRKRYSEGNLMVVMICEEEHTANRAVMHDIEDLLKEKGVYLYTIQLGENPTKSAKGTRSSKRH